MRDQGDRPSGGNAGSREASSREASSREADAREADARERGARELDESGYIIAHSETVPFDEIGHAEQRARSARVRRDLRISRFFAALRDGSDIERDIFEWFGKVDLVTVTSAYWNGEEIVCTDPAYLRGLIAAHADAFFNHAVHPHPSRPYFKRYITREAFARFNPEFLSYLHRRATSYSPMRRRGRKAVDAERFPRA